MSQPFPQAFECMLIIALAKEQTLSSVCDLKSGSAAAKKNKEDSQQRKSIKLQRHAVVMLVQTAKNRQEGMETVSCHLHL